MTNKQPYKVCGSETFVKGKLGNGYAHVTLVDKLIDSTPLLLTFCKK